MLRIPEESQAGGAPLKLSGLLVTALDDLFWQIGQSSSVEAVALGTGAGDELVEERYGLLTRILTFVLHHTSLGRAGATVDSHPVRRPVSNQATALLYSPCGPASRPGFWRSPPPVSGSVWRRACDSRSSRRAPSPQRWRSLCRHMWLCPSLPNSRG